MKSGSQLYLDVTSACQSPLNTGVKRIQRTLYAWLKQFTACIPVCWQSVRGDYRTLTTRDEANLQMRASDSARGLALYDAPFLAGFVSDSLHYWRDAAVSLRWPKELQAGDIVFVPDLLWDGRSRFFERMQDCPARWVGVFHDAIGLRRPEQSRLDSFFCARGVRALSRFDLVLCISREAEADLHDFWGKFGLRPAPTLVAPWPVPFHSERPEQAPRFSARSLLYVARLEAHKNHPRLLDACEKLWNQGERFRLRLIGCNAYPSYSGGVRRRIEALRRQGRDIELNAHVSDEELRAAYRDCSFTVFPSLLEGFGLPILESLWHGRPVVCGATGAVGEVASDGGCETIDPRNVDDLARGIQTLLNDEPRYRELCSQIQRRAFRRWSDYWAEITPALDLVCQCEAPPLHSNP